MASYVLLLLLLTTTVLVVAAWALVRFARKPLHRDRRADDADGPGAERSFLVNNWAHVEETALNHGMTPEEVAEVRKKLFAS